MNPKIDPRDWADLESAASPDRGEPHEGAGLAPTLTDGFVAAFAADEACRGGVAHLAAVGLLPTGVDGQDPRVAAVMVRCRHAMAVEYNDVTCLFD